MGPLLSIAIPTKDRYDTLFPVLHALLKYIQGTDFEIIVQDNTIHNAEATVEIANIKDPRIKYYHTANSLSVTDNSNLAIEHCEGNYLTFIGDDDIVSPYILQILAKVKSAGLDCLIYEKGNYFWQGLKMYKEYAFHYPASLQYPKNISTDIELLSVEKELEFVLKAGGDGYYRLPSLYHGIISREVLNMLKKKFGTYVPGSCPDIAIAMALSSVVNKYGFMNYPVTITGASKKSAAGMGVRNAHVARIEEVTWLPKNIIETWDSKVPKIWTGRTIYAQNIHEILTQLKIDKTIDYSSLYSNLFVKEPKIKKIVFPFLLGVRMNLPKKIDYIFSTFVKALLYYLLYKSPSYLINAYYLLKGDFKRRSQCLHIENVDKCMLHLIEICKLK
jgi:glycosyltransferase involved in cell wall biosynthesis